MSGRPSREQGQYHDYLFQFCRTCSRVVRLANSQALNGSEKLPGLWEGTVEKNIISLRLGAKDQTQVPSHPGTP